jgi:pilus assembly protein Flp/PilA
MSGKHLAGCGEENGGRGRCWPHQVVNQEWPMLRLTRILRCERAATAIEYALVASLISIAALAAFQGLGAKITSMFVNVSTKM